MPWIGYFGMINSVDEFVFLDNVQFSKRSWQQRNKIKTSNGELFLTVSVMTKGQKDQAIKDTLLDKDHFSPEKMLATISQNYSQTKYFNENFPELKSIFLKNQNNLCDLNIELIEFFCSKMGIKTPFLRSSSLGIEGSKADLLSDICLKRDANIYLSAPGSKEYIEESTAFQDKGIQVVYHNYEHPVYHQKGDFMPYMTIVDLLFNEGPASLGIILSGYKI